MARLADMLIATMGWANSHLHTFRVGDARYGMHDERLAGDTDESTVTVRQALRDERHFTFDYDFGDSWEHEVVIEELSWAHFGLRYAVCLDGANACPPEDVGGVPGYSHFLEAIADPLHEEHESWLEWIEGSFDPSKFSVAEANAVLQKVR